MLETVLHAQAEGMSVRGITLKMGQGDKKAMLRYQNKYRSMVKHKPDAIYAAIERLKNKGLSTYDPYSEPRVHKAGRKPDVYKRQGFSIGAAALTALALFSSFADKMQLSAVSILEAPVIIGLFVGGMLSLSLIHI